MARKTLRSVIFDWAGTAVDFGSMAPLAAFAAAFEDARVPVRVDEIRKPMGLEKRRHLAQMLDDSEIAARWRRVHGKDANERDVDALYEVFNHRLADLLPRYADPVPGLLDAVAALRARGLRIGSNSGYSATMMKVLARAAREHGFSPDCIVSASDVARGRPAPDLSLRCLELLGLGPEDGAIKVDDTGVGIEEGRNAGLWTVAVAISGNEVGLSLAEWSALSTREQTHVRARARERLQSAAPDYVIETVADLDPVVEAIQARIAAGERPVAI
jgi:phosphonoacetaldehyde hydrolase